MHTVEEGDQTMEEAKELRLFAKEFGQGVRQQRVRGKTPRKSGNTTLGYFDDEKNHCAPNSKFKYA